MKMTSVYRVLYQHNAKVADEETAVAVTDILLCSATAADATSLALMTVSCVSFVGRHCSAQTPCVA